MAINEANHTRHVIMPLNSKYPQISKMPVSIVTRNGVKKQHIKVAKKASSVASWWKSVFSKVNMVNDMPTITNWACQQVCIAGMADMANQ